MYLERIFPLFHTDCEYNRRKHNAKELHPEMGGRAKEICAWILLFMFAILRITYWR